MLGASKSLAYGLLERLTGGRGIERSVNGEAIRFPARWFRYYESDYEAATFHFVRAHLRPGDVALDCGAHLGLFSVTMGRIVGPEGRVFSFEPTPGTRAVLKETVRLNNLSRVVHVRPHAISRESGQALFFDTGEAGSNANSLVSGQRASSGFEVPTISCDDLVCTERISPRLIKMDVEGAEQDALEGAVKTLESCRPALSLGLHPEALARSGGSLQRIYTLLRDLGYKVRHEGREVDAGWFVKQTLLFDIQAVVEG